jgi:hypothetical protein
VGSKNRIPALSVLLYSHNIDTIISKLIKKFTEFMTKG